MRPLVTLLALFYSAFLFAVAIAAAPSSGCTGNQRATTLHASIVAVDAARDGFVAWDKQHQHGIVMAATSEDEAKTNLAVYRKQRDMVIEAFSAAYHALALAATGTDTASLERAQHEAGEVFASVKALMTMGGP